LLGKSLPKTFSGRSIQSEIGMAVQDRNTPSAFLLSANLDASKNTSMGVVDGTEGWISLSCPGTFFRNNNYDTRFDFS